MFFGVLWLSGVSTASRDLTPQIGAGAYRSVVDDDCAAKWVKNARNDTALICYLTMKVGRLCHDDEQKHLAGIITSYRAQAIFHDSQLAKTGIMAASAIGDENPEMLEMARAYSAAPKAPLAEPVAKWAKQSIETYMRKYKDLPDDTIAPGLHLPRVREEVLIRHIQDIGEKGYMKKWNFGQFVDPLVSAAFDTLQTGDLACAS